VFPPGLTVKIAVFAISCLLTAAAWYMGQYPPWDSFP
jgi:hypothetical protein